MLCIKRGKEREEGRGVDTEEVAEEER